MTSLQDLLPEPGTSNWRKSKTYSTDSSDVDDASVRHVVIREVWLENRPTPHAVYKIDVMSKSAHWSVFRRYREFYQLHQLLMKKYGMPKELLPPRKLTNSLAKDTLYKRREALEHFLQRVINSSGRGVSCSDEVLDFLDVKSHDVSLVSHTLAKFLKEKGDGILASGEGFQFSPSQLYCITKQLRLPHPWSAQRVDLSHLYDFVTRVNKVMVSDMVATASRGQQHISNVTYDISLFSSLRELQLDGCQITCVNGFSSLPNKLVKLAARYSVRSMKELLVDSATETRKAPIQPNAADNWRAQAAMRLAENRIIVQPWVCLSSVNLSHNTISALDSSLSLLPVIKELDLSYNRITHLDLTLLADSPLQKLSLVANEVYLISGSTKTNEQLLELNLRSNRIHTIEGLLCLQRLESLDLAQNSIVLMAEIRKLGALSRLCRLWVAGNPISKRKRHRIMALYYFRLREFELDGRAVSGKEKAKIDAKVRQTGDESAGTDDSVSISTVSDDDRDSGIDEHGQPSRLEPLLEEEYYIVGRNLEPINIVRESPQEEELHTELTEDEYAQEEEAATNESRSRDEWDKILRSKSSSGDRKVSVASVRECKPTLLTQSRVWLDDAQRVSIFERLNSEDSVGDSCAAVPHLSATVSNTHELLTCEQEENGEVRDENPQVSVETRQCVKKGTLLFKSLSVQSEDGNEGQQSDNCGVSVASYNVVQQNIAQNCMITSDAIRNGVTLNDAIHTDLAQGEAIPGHTLSNNSSPNEGLSEELNPEINSDRSIEGIHVTDSVAASGIIKCFESNVLEESSSQNGFQSQNSDEITFDWGHFVPPTITDNSTVSEQLTKSLSSRVSSVEEVIGTESNEPVSLNFNECERAEECSED